MQCLVAAKSRLSKSKLTIPRLELVAGYMVLNLAVNVRNALEGFNVAEKICCWLDSSVALHWLNDDGQYRQFVDNRVAKMRKHDNALWHHVPSSENPAGLGSRGGSVDGAILWCYGPEWLADESKGPPKIVTKASEISDAEKKVLQELSAVGVETNEEKICVEQAQKQNENTAKFTEDKAQLGLERNEKGIWECHGRIQGEYPIYLPDTAMLTTKIVQRAHLSTLHGRVGMVMSKVRENYWVPRLRKLVKKVLSKCYGCKKVRARPANAPPSGLLPKCRTEQATPFQVIDLTDYSLFTQ